RSEDSYRFLHDRVQEAPYSFIPQQLRAETHLRIGRLLVERTPSNEREERIFEIVNQFNRAAHLSTNDERRRVAELNLIAARRAKFSIAYASALSYLEMGRGLLTEESSNTDYELVFSVEHLIAECELLTRDMESAETCLLTEFLTTAMFFDQDLCAFVICRMMNLSIEHGDNDASCVAYLWFGIVAGQLFGNYEGAFKFGQLGYGLMERRGLKRYEARNCLC